MKMSHAAVRMSRLLHRTPSRRSSNLLSWSLSDYWISSSGLEWYTKSSSFSSSSQQALLGRSDSIIMPLSEEGFHGQENATDPKLTITTDAVIWHIPKRKDDEDPYCHDCGTELSTPFRKALPYYAASSTMSASRWRTSSPTFSSLSTVVSLSQSRTLPFKVMCYHTSTRQERTAVTLMLGLGALSATSYAVSQGLRAYREWKERQPPPPTPSEEDMSNTGGSASTATDAEDVDGAEKENKEKTSTTTEESGASDSKRENIFAKWFGVGVGTKYYEGGFEDTMTRREAALILGIRESSSPARIKEAHRKLLVINHPDTGGSTYIAGKINEAKELLLKGKRER